MRAWLPTLFTACGLCLLLVGCDPKPEDASPSSEPSATSAPSSAAELQKPAIDVSSGKYEPFKEPATGDEIAVLDTEQGKIVLRFFEDAAPNHVKNFKDLAKKGFYDGTRFHRVIPGFMIQGGDPNTKSGDPSTWGTGGPGYKVNQEFNPIPHKRGILSMARTGDPNGAGSQFFVMHADYPSLNNQYTVFGAVVTGIETVDKIVMTPTTDNNGTVEPGKAVRIKGVKLAKWPVK